MSVQVLEHHMQWLCGQAIAAHSLVQQPIVLRQLAEQEHEQAAQVVGGAQRAVQAGRVLQQAVVKMRPRALLLCVRASSNA